MAKVPLHLGDVTIELALESHDVEVAGLPYMDWLRCRVRVTDQGFTGVAQWNVMPDELSRLATDLVRIYDAYPKRERAEFKPTEPNLRLTLAVGTRGQVEGTYELVGGFGDGPTMRGSFIIEQAALPNLAAEIREFVAASASHAV